MRFKMGESPETSRLLDIIIQLTNGEQFIPQRYLDYGYNQYEVVCIGASGGRGGGVGTISQGWGGRVIFGGGGGGGGLHRVIGFLDELPATCAVVVGTQGLNGYSYTGSQTSGPPGPGTDGGYSSFAGTVCRASGGKGGLIPTIASMPSTSVGGLGGAGGEGNSITAGGGAASQQDGNWNGTIGSGGGGGKGGNISWTPVNGYYGASGLAGKGNYSASDPDWSGPIKINPPHPFAPVEAATGGGASLFPFNGDSSTVWGGWEDTPAGICPSGSGAVFIKLSQI